MGAAAIASFKGSEGRVSIKYMPLIVGVAFLGGY